MKPYKMTNRYGDEFTFTPQEDGTILWEGNFEYCRFGWPNDYTKAWEAFQEKVFQEEYPDWTYVEFLNNIHNYDEKTNSYEFAEILPLITSNTSRINMIDPSGGPYLTIGMAVESISEELEDMEISHFESVEEGWKIYLKEA
jgi:hypothetical protein